MSATFIELSPLFCEKKPSLPLGCIAKDTELGLSLAVPKRNGNSEFCFGFSTECCDIAYMLPGQDFLQSREFGSYSTQYGARFPLPFMSVFCGKIGISVISVSASDKDLALEKSERGVRLTFKIKDGPQSAEFLIVRHEPTVHGALFAYKRYYRSRNEKRESNVFRGRFHFKRYALYGAHLANYLRRGSSYGLLDEYEKDVERLGGIDVLQLFDWAYTERDGRVGSYKPWDELQGADELSAQIKTIRGKGSITAAYVDAYFVKKGSSLSKRFGEDKTIKDGSGEPYYQLGEDHWVICPYDREWRKFLSDAAKEVHERLCVDSIYVDQCGYGTQYACHDPSHDHSVTGQNFGEEGLVRDISDAAGLPVMIEYFPQSNMLRYIDAALTDNDNNVVFSRFAHPEVKQFKVINCDEPIGDNTEAVIKAFFNGIGLWLDGDSADAKWYSDRVRALIAKHYRIMRRYADVFDGDNPLPLIPTLNERVLCNLFRSENESVYTVFNASDESFSGALIPVGHLPVERLRFFDIYGDGNEIFPLSTDSGIFLPCSVEARCGTAILCKTK